MEPFIIFFKKDSIPAAIGLLIVFAYNLFKRNKILLEIDLNDKIVIIRSYSILNGKKELNLKIDDIIEIDFFRGLFIKYKNHNEKTAQSFEINAEPWNSLYGQIRQLKLSVQENDKKLKNQSVANSA
ncbi:MAG: hypothetical protein Q8O62_06410 [Aequorivita sp.]|nr:hypothetical protein [Aequorivita sp.]